MSTKVILARLIPRKKDDGSFDAEFWGKISPIKKLSLSWEMVCDLANWNKKYVHQQRLQRTLAVLKPRKG